MSSGVDPVGQACKVSAAAGSSALPDPAAGSGAALIDASIFGKRMMFNRFATTD